MHHLSPTTHSSAEFLFLFPKPWTSDVYIRCGLLWTYWVYKLMAKNGMRQQEWFEGFLFRYILRFFGVVLIWIQWEEMQRQVAPSNFATFNLLFVAVTTEVHITYDRNTLTHQGWKRKCRFCIKCCRPWEDHRPQHLPTTQTEQTDQTPPKEVRSPKKRGKRAGGEV